MNEELQTKIGTEEATSIAPAQVVIEDVTIEEVGTKKSKKVVLLCKHPASEKSIKISETKYLKNDNLETSGLWVNLDSKKELRKGSALVVTLQQFGCKVIADLKGKTVPTILDSNGYLAVKAY